VMTLDDRGSCNGRGKGYGRRAPQSRPRIPGPSHPAGSRRSLAVRAGPQGLGSPRNSSAHTRAGRPQPKCHLMRLVPIRAAAGFDNRRQVAAYAGLAPTPWKSGSIDHEQGVSKAGNPRLRTTMVELAWLWLENQPTSALSLWFNERVRRLGGRMRKTIIVALARKLLIALWRYTTAGVVIERAVMKAASATI
jgi:hypothetical protein